MISFAGQLLASPTPEISDWVERFIDSHELYEFTAKTLNILPFEVGSAGDYRPNRVIRLGSLHWPVGASRWATFHGLATFDQLTAMENHCYGPTNPIPADLGISDGTRSISTKMYLLPSRPLSDCQDAQGLYLVSLVDERYFWWHLSSQIDCREGVTTFAQLYSAAQYELQQKFPSTTLTYSVVSSEYSPGAGLKLSAGQFPLWLDAVARSCGQRIVRNLTGTVVAQSADTAITSAANSLQVGYPVYRGGEIDPSAVASGSMPEAVAVYFPRSRAGSVLYKTPARSVGTEAYFYSVTKTAAVLALPELGGYNFAPGTKPIFTGALATTTGSSGGEVPSNSATLGTLATRIATDFYLWSLGTVDITYCGVAGWTLDGFHDVEWFQFADGSFGTRISRSEWDYGGGMMLLGSGSAESESCVIPAIIRIDGGNATSGYEWTAMQQMDADFLEVEEITGLDSTSLGYLAAAANGLDVSPGDTTYPGQLDLCRGKAFFFGGTDPGRVIVEFQETTPSMGELYLANIRTELVDSGGLVSWSTGATVYAFPINSGTTPTLETLYFAFRTEEEETVEGLPVYEVDRCCDSIVDQSSSGSGDNVLGGIPCGAWTTVSVTYQYGSGPTVAVDCVGPGLFASDIFEYDPTNYPGWMVRLYFECNEGLTGHPAVTTESGTQPAEFSTAIRGDNHDTTTGPFVWDGVTDWDEYGDVSGSGYGGTFTIVSAS